MLSTGLYQNKLLKSMGWEVGKTAHVAYLVSNLQHHRWYSDNHQGSLLNTEPGIASEHCWVWSLLSPVPHFMKFYCCNCRKTTWYLTGDTISGGGMNMVLKNCFDSFWYYLLLCHKRNLLFGVEMNLGK